MRCDSIFVELNSLKSVFQDVGEILDLVHDLTSNVSFENLYNYLLFNSVGEVGELCDATRQLLIQLSLSTMRKD